MIALLCVTAAATLLSIAVWMRVGALTDRPPPSIVLQMLAVEFAERDDLLRAKELYIMSLEQNPDNETARTRLEEMGVDVDALLSASSQRGDTQ